MLAASPSTAYLPTLPAGLPKKACVQRSFAASWPQPSHRSKKLDSHLSSSCSIAPLPLSAPFSERLSAFPCQTEVSQLQRPHCIHVLPPLFQFSLSQLCAIPSHARHQLDFLPLTSSVRPFKHRETMLQDQTAPTQTNH